jgi:hypothetical protein
LQFKLHLNAGLAETSSSQFVAGIMAWQELQGPYCTRAAAQRLGVPLLLQHTSQLLRGQLLLQLLLCLLHRQLSTV